MISVLAPSTTSKPAPAVPAAALEFAAGSGLPVMLAAPRAVTGRYASKLARDSVTPVVLPTGVVAHQVGFGGRIFAERDAALRFANMRRSKLAAAGSCVGH